MTYTFLALQEIGPDGEIIQQSSLQYGNAHSFLLCSKSDIVNKLVICVECVPYNGLMIDGNVTNYNYETAVAGKSHLGV